jgi:hypothetical protein
VLLVGLTCTDHRLTLAYRFKQHHLNAFRRKTDPNQEVSSEWTHAYHQSVRKKLNNDLDLYSTPTTTTLTYRIFHSTHFPSSQALSSCLSSSVYFSCWRSKPGNKGFMEPVVPGKQRIRTKWYLRTLNKQNESRLLYPVSKVLISHQS